MPPHISIPLNELKLNLMAKLSRKWRQILLTLSILATLTLFAVLSVAHILFAPNIQLRNNEQPTYLYVADKCSFEDIVTQLDTIVSLKSKYFFTLAAELLDYDTNIRPGRYKISDRMSNLNLIRKLRSGNQDPLQLRFHNIRTKEQLAARISSQIMADSADIAQLLHNEEFLAKYDLNPNTAVALFIPNTYEVFWNMTAEQLFQRMKREHDVFWNEERRAKAAAIPLTPIEVSTLASIVEEETNKAFEYPIIAGLYINRLNRRMPLQACPTVKYALNDFTIRRILYVHLRTESPYNTYQNSGLPPGPIRLASPAVLDAVLNYEKHNYLFMTAKETFNGEHNFAATNAEHARNARRYQQALNQRGIMN